MSVEPVEAVDIALKGMNKFRERILSELDSAEQAALFEALRSQSQHAATVQGEADLIAFSESIYRIIDDSPKLRGFLPPKEWKASKTRDVSDEADELAYRDSSATKVAGKRAADISNKLLFFVRGTRTYQSSRLESTPPPPPSPPSWWSRILNWFRGQNR